MAVITITRKYKAGTAAERAALTPSAEAGTVFWETDSADLGIYACDGVNWVKIGSGPLNRI